MNNKYFKGHNINNDCQRNIINNMSGLIPENILNKLFECAIDCKEKEIINILEYIYKSSYSLTLQLEKISDLIIFNKKLSDKNKALIIQKLTDIDQYLIKGCDEYIQYYNLIYFIINIQK